MDWHLAPSLAKLRREINATWPNRDKTSDGTIGDASHSSRTSDHNPNSRGSVNAYDIDEDGPDMAYLLRTFINDPRVNYVIYEGFIYSRKYGFAKRAYTGVNAHKQHMHVSILQTPEAENNTASWFTYTPPVIQPQEDDVNDTEHAWLSNIENRTKNLESAYTRDINGDIQPRLGRIEQKLESLATGAVDVEAIAKRVDELLAERLKD